jgi:hypothetical protein
MQVADYIEVNLVHSVHTSGGKSFLGCRRRWDWIYNGYYYPTVTAKPLEFGVAFHAGMEKLYDPLTWHDKQLRMALALGTFKQTCDVQFLEFTKKNPELVTNEVREDYKERKELGKNMLKYYIANIASRADVGLTPVKVEVAFEVPITGPKGETLWCKCDTCWKRYDAFHRSPERGEAKWVGPIGDVEKFKKERWQGLPVTFGGRIDALMQDELGRYWIYDWKTAAVLSTREEYLWIEFQITSYLWALWTLGIPVAGFIYAEMRKGTPEEPEPLSRPYKGKLYSTNKMNPMTYDVFYRTISENDNLALINGLYDDYLEYLKGPESPKFHQRFQIARTVTELRNAGQDIYNLAADMTDPNVRIYPNSGKFNCQYCAFYDPCLSKNRGEDYLYTLDTLYDKKPRHYYETAKSTDKRGAGE